MITRTARVSKVLALSGWSLIGDWRREGALRVHPQQRERIRVRGVILGLAVLGLLPLGGCEKYELDRRMEELCKKDGGIKIHETVTLPPEMFDQDGDPFPGWRKRSEYERLGPDYRLVQQTTYLKQGEPLKGEGRLDRSHWKVVRNSDNKILGEGVSYGRSGGDFIVLGHFTSKSCPPRFGEDQALIHSVFIKRGN